MKDYPHDLLQLCLDFLNAVVCYSSLPPDALHSFVTTLCHTLNIERFSKKSLEVRGWADPL